MSEPDWLAEIAARHDIARSDRRHSIVKAFKDAHNDRATLLRAYRELASELEAVSKSFDAAHVEVERLTLELQVSTQQAGELRDERDRLRTSNAKAFEAGWRTAAEWAHRDDLLADIGSPAYLADQVKALADAQHLDPEYQPLDAYGNPIAHAQHPEQQPNGNAELRVMHADRKKLLAALNAISLGLSSYEARALAKRTVREAGLIAWSCRDEAAGRTPCANWCGNEATCTVARDEVAK